MKIQIKENFMRTRDNNYIPDILETIANLSNDEVFTPPKLANDILDLLPKEIWKDSTVTFLDPAVKTGIFLREIARRLIEGLADEIPDLQERVNHILTKQVFGLAITELTSLMARRTVYCAMEANSPLSVCTEFADAIGNIKFPDTKHSWNENSRCEYCGANELTYNRGADRENYAYPFIHNFNIKETFGDMKFDVIIGNPPYQMNTGGGLSSNAIPLYQLFVEKAIELDPKYIAMITPSRWMKGGKGLRQFRENMIEDKRLKVIFDYEDSSKIFPSVNIDGGISYFLWDSKHNGKVEYHYTDSKNIYNYSKRFLKINNYNQIVRDNRQLSIILKIISKDETRFSEIVGSSGGSFGFNTFLFSEPERYPNVDLKNKKEKGYYLIYGVVGKAGGAKRVEKYINKESIELGKESINKYKLFFSKSFSPSATIPPEIIKGNPGSLSTATFTKIGDFDTKEEMDNCKEYMETSFFRALFKFNRSSFAATRSTFELIPLQDFSKSWTDEELYKKYGLTEEEIAYIEENIDPMTGSEEEYLDAFDESELEEEEIDE